MAPHQQPASLALPPTVYLPTDQPTSLTTLLTAHLFMSPYRAASLALPPIAYRLKARQQPASFTPVIQLLTAPQADQSNVQQFHSTTMRPNQRNNRSFSYSTFYFSSKALPPRINSVSSSLLIFKLLDAPISPRPQQAILSR